jgi:hypothetical protein
MRFTALIVAASICLASHPLVSQQDGPRGSAVTRVATPLRESPSVESRAFATIPPKTFVNATSCVDGWCAVEYQNFTGHVVQVFLRFPPPLEASQKPIASVGRGYTNSRGEHVASPVHTLDGQPAAGASAKCRDGSFSFSRSRSGTCSHHGGVGQWL